MKDVLCAAFAGLSVAVPGAYGMNNAFHGYVPRVFGLLNTPDTENAATISEAPEAAPCGGATYGDARQIRIFADANCASAPLVTRST